MSGKYVRKKTRKNRRLLWFLLVLLGLILAGLVWAWISSGDVDPGFTPPETEGKQETTPAETGEATEATGQTQPVQQIAVPLELGDGIVIEEFLRYTGAFVEDRTDEVLTDILAIRVTNNGENFIQTMDITLVSENGEALFSLSTLFPGESVVVMEKNRMRFSTAPEFTAVSVSNLALFAEHPGMCDDKLEIQCLDGVINITNISGEDITGDIFVYYKNKVGGIYYGGITYRIRLEGGMKAGEIRQGSAAHFNPDNSVVVFVICG